MSPSDLARLRAADPDRMAAADLAPRAARADLHTLYGFALEVGAIAERTREEMVGRIRLAWWAEALEALAQGAAPRAHPVLEALADVAARRALPLEPLVGYAEARAADFESQPFTNLTAAQAYLDATAGAVMGAALAICGVGPGGAAIAHAGGRAWGLTGLIRAAPFWAQRGRDVLPPGGVQAAAAEARAALAEARALVHTLPSRGWPAVAYLALVPQRLAGGPARDDGRRRLTLVWATLRGRI